MPSEKPFHSHFVQVNFYKKRILFFSYLLATLFFKRFIIKISESKV